MSEPVYSFQMTLRDADGTAIAERVVTCEYDKVGYAVDQWKAQMELEANDACYVHVVRMR